MTAEVIDFLKRRVDAAVSAGVDPADVLVDPGIGFGKTLEHNLELLRRLRELADAVGAAGGAGDEPQGVYRAHHRRGRAVAAAVRHGGDRRVGNSKRRGGVTCP